MVGSFKTRGMDRGVHLTRLGNLLLAWHLLMPLLAYNRETDCFVWVSDAPLAQWYYKGEFATLGAWNTARDEEIAKQQQAPTHRADGTPYDREGLGRASIAAPQHARCLTDGDLKAPPRRAEPGLRGAWYSPVRVQACTHPPS